MNIITWNCNMAFRKKWHAIIPVFMPDILVIQECEHPSKYKPLQVIPGLNEFIWIGNNQNKGLGIISFNNYHIELCNSHNTDFEYIAPIKATGEVELNMLAVWAMPHKIRAMGYVGQVWRAINYYKRILETDSIIIGDLNSNAQWNGERKNGNHADVVSFLEKYNITSLYHNQNDLPHGDEPDPTLYLLKNKMKPFHMDYCFASKSLITPKTSLEVGRFDDWIKLSDHMPIITTGLGG